MLQKAYHLPVSNCILYDGEDKIIIIVKTGY